MPATTAQKIRIAHVLPTFDVGGLENGVINLINNADTDAFEHHVIALSGKATAAARFQRAIPVTCLHKRPGNDWRIPVALARLFRANGIDLVRTYAWGSWMEGALGALLAGFVTHVHSEHGFIINDDCQVPRRQRIAQYLLALLTRRIIAVSESIRQSLIDHVRISPRRIDTIINGVDTDKFAPCACAADTLGVQLPAAAKLVCGTVARLDPVKDHKTAIDAVLRNPGVIYLIIGDGPERHALERHIAEKQAGDQILLLGERRDIPQLMGCLDLYLLSSLREGTSNTVLEAMSCGVPVCASAVGGNLKIIDDARNGFLFPAGDVDALAALIAQHGRDTDRFTEAAHTAREQILANYSLQQMVSRYESLYRQLLRH